MRLVPIRVYGPGYLGINRKQKLRSLVGIRFSAKEESASLTLSKYLLKLMTLTECEEQELKTSKNIESSVWNFMLYIRILVVC